MSRKKIHFMGLLANVDSSILNVNLNHGFNIQAISDEEGVSFISILENLPFMEILKKLSMDFHCRCPSEKKIYYIGNSFEGDIEMNDEGKLTSFPTFNSELIYSYLHPIIRLMRLFKEGNICMPLEYYFFIDNNTPKSIIRKSTGLYISPGPIYALKNSEILDLESFIQNTKLPFKESFLQLAFENFELSYQVHDINLSFLSLMISLETLFNPGEQELRYRVSRNAAVFLGKDKEDSKKIFSEIKNLYDKRSRIVHKGETNIVNKEDLLKLRHYVRESIKEISKISKIKNELLEILNSCGFGERAWA